MSTRYVWGRYLPSTNPVLNETYRLTTNYELGYHESDFDFCTIQDEYTVNTNNSSVYYKNFGKKSLLSIYQQYSETSIDLQPLNVSGGQVSLADGDKFVFSTEQSATLTDDSYISECDASNGMEITFKKRSNGKVYYTVASNTSEGNIKRIITKNTLTTETIAGTPDGTVSNSNPSAYPSNGVSGSYWYEYQGQDTIDPAGVDYVSSPQGGKPITLTVTPSAGKVYGGTVSYQYQVKLGDGDWQTIATTSATSYQYTIPYGTTTFQARVRAQDNLGFTSNDYVTGTQVTVINNQPPTAPGSIAVTNVVAGQQATITLTAATDPDGTIASYIYERSVDGSAWTQIANVNALTYQDTVSGDWGTVAYRACAVDDDGASGPYVTSETTTVNSGWVIISGPASDMGEKPAPFKFVFSVSVTGQASVDAINVAVTMDGESVYTGTPNSGVEVSIPIDTRLMSAGEHKVEVLATKESYVEARGAYTFEVPTVTLPDGGRAEMLQNPEGDVVFPYTLARLVIGKGGKDLNELLEQALSTVTDLSGEVAEVKAGALKIQTGTYVGTGTSGSSNQNVLNFDFTPVFVYISESGPDNPSAVMWPYIWGASVFGIKDGTDSRIYSCIVSTSGNSMTWWGSGTTAQFNNSGMTYRYVAIGH